MINIEKYFHSLGLIFTKDVEFYSFEKEYHSVIAFEVMLKNRVF